MDPTVFRRCTLTALSVASLISLTPPHVHASGRSLSHEQPAVIRLRVYLLTPLDARTLARATELATEVFERARLVPIWLDCTDERLAPACALPLKPGDFLVRVLPARQDRSSRACGVAIRSGDGAIGHLITLFLDCLQQGAAEFHVPLAVVVAYTILHEVGHHLLSAAHTTSGIMRQRHDLIDWQRAALGALRFSSAEEAVMRATLRTNSGR